MTVCITQPSSTRAETHIDSKRNRARPGLDSPLFVLKTLLAPLHLLVPLIAFDLGPEFSPTRFSISVPWAVPHWKTARRYVDTDEDKGSSLIGRDRLNRGTARQYRAAGRGLAFG
jgi:hypothetical protein